MLTLFHVMYVMLSIVVLYRIPQFYSSNTKISPRALGLPSGPGATAVEKRKENIPTYFNQAIV